MKDKFEIREKVKVYTKFYDYQDKFWLPDDVLYFGESFITDGNSLILWHGTLHSVPTGDIHKIREL